MTEEEETSAKKEAGMDSKNLLEVPGINEKDAHWLMQQNLFDKK